MDRKKILRSGAKNEPRPLIAEVQEGRQCGEASDEGDYEGPRSLHRSINDNRKYGT